MGSDRINVFKYFLDEKELTLPKWLAAMCDRHKLIGNPGPQMPRPLHHRPG